MVQFKPQDVAYLTHQLNVLNNLTYGLREGNVLFLGGTESNIRLEPA